LSSTAIQLDENGGTREVLPVLPSVIAFTRDGAPFEIRSIHPSDEARMIRFHKGLSERSVYMRYFESLSLSARTAHPRLSRICFVDSGRETVLVAVVDDRDTGEREIAAVGRLNKLADANKAEVALLVLDKFQGRGIGTELLKQLIYLARNQKITQIEAEMLRDNTAIQRVLKKRGFHLKLVDPRSVRAVLAL
jgi:acetyltransferase